LLSDLSTVVIFQVFFSFGILMSTKTQPSQTGDTAPSTTSTTSTFKTLETNPQDSHNTPGVEENKEVPDSGGGDEIPGDTTPSGFTLLMTIAALAMSMFLVRSYH
jgi:hypothetical protein